MNLSMLERRAFPRTRAFVPITLQFINSEDDTPAHLLDISCCGAALMTTTQNAPTLGQYLHLRFEMPVSDGAAESRPREELAVVVNIRRPQRGVARVGVRFVHQVDLHPNLGGPDDILSDHRRFIKSKSGLGDDRWSFLDDAVKGHRPLPAMADVN